MKGINKPHSIKVIMGERLQMARKEAGLTRQELADKLSQNKNAPSSEMTMERLKQWEYGKNAIAIDWIPAICDELSFDVGYLFGEYSEHNRIASDIVRETGLSEAAILSLQYVRNLNPEYINVLSVLLQDGNLEYFLYLIHKRFLQSLTKGMTKPVVELENGSFHLKNAKEYHDFVRSREIEIPFDGAILLAQKANLLDSLISSTILSRLEVLSAEYKSVKEDTNGQHHKDS